MSKYLSREAYEKALRLSREAKRRRQGTCEECGAETRYHGHGQQTVSRFCVACAARRAGLKRRGKGPETQRILDILIERGPMRFMEIAQASGKPKNSLSRFIYGVLLPYGLIERRARGVYAIPGDKR